MGGSHSQSDAAEHPVFTEPLFMSQKLMSSLEDKEKELNKLKVRVDTLLKNDHPASDKIEVWTRSYLNTA